MITRIENSRIHTLAVKTVQSIEQYYQSRPFMFTIWFGDNPRNDQLLLLTSFLKTNHGADEAIISQFELAIGELAKLKSDENLIFIIQAKEFIEKAKLILELQQSQAENVRLNNALIKSVPSYYNNNYSPFAIFFQMPELLTNILLFLDIKQLSLISTTSRGFSDIISNKKFKETVNEIAERHKEYLQSGMHLFFRTPPGRIVAFDTTPGSTINDVKEQFANKVNIPKNQLRFIFAGQHLDDDRTLDSYKIEHYSTVRQEFRLAGD